MKQFFVMVYEIFVKHTLLFNLGERSFIYLMSQLHSRCTLLKPCFVHIGHINFDFNRCSVFTECCFKITPPQIPIPCQISEVGTFPVPLAILGKLWDRGICVIWLHCAAKPSSKETKFERSDQEICPSEDKNARVVIKL